MATTLPHPRSFNDIAIKGDYKPATKYKGQSAISFSDEEINNLSARFVRTIVGRFTKGRPCRISNFDSPLIPVWISLEGLPIHLFDSLALYSIANSIGKPLKTDAATACLSRPSFARICVEVDTSKELPHGEDLPEYCPSCKSFGHKNCKKATRSSRWLVKESPGTGNTALAVAVPLLQTVDTTLKLVAKQADEQIQEPGAETLEIDHEVQSASDMYTNMARVEALETTIVNGRDVMAPEPAGSAEVKTVLVELEQICVGEDAQETIQNPTYIDPNSENEQSCVAHKLSPKTDLEGTQYKEEFPPLTITTGDFPAQNYNSDAHTLSLKKEMDGTLSPSIKGDDETISDPSFRQVFSHL
ncbi:unnamed protein product [Cuscuta campestris]|uniref:Uncharacterized protein n=1 Tax=Cuscuta campestris TaxID=132261 RepID=A0A484LD88_9ASTE|nr:unnamed protein product [Cuscuta campestris]